MPWSKSVVSEGVHALEYECCVRRSTCPGVRVFCQEEYMPWSTSVVSNCYHTITALIIFITTIVCKSFALFKYHY